LFWGIGFFLRRFMRSSSDFLASGRSIPAWVAGLAFLSANLGAQEVIGMAASGAKYGIATSHFYWLGAIPAMVFVGIFMMPFYYGSKARSVPDYLSLRFDEKTRGLNAITFAVMTVMSSGISMYAMALLIQTLHIFDSPIRALGLPNDWVFHASIIVSAVIVLAYIFLGGLTSAIYNEVLQFFLIVAGFLPLVMLGLINVGGWQGLQQKLPPAYLHAWAGLDNPKNNPLGVEWFSLIMGLGFVLSFGYWCTDFLVVQRAMAADSMASARRTPLIAAVPKMLFPFLVILPGLLALPLTHPTNSGGPEAEKSAPPAAAVTATSPGDLIPPETNPQTGEIGLSEGAVPGIKGGWITVLHSYPSQMAQNFWTAIYAWVVCFVATIVLSLFTRPRPEEELRGLVYTLTEKETSAGGPWYSRPVPLGIGVLILTLILNIIFW
jgi:solute:Na+ symporter, SSS family